MVEITVRAADSSLAMEEARGLAMTHLLYLRAKKTVRLKSLQQMMSRH